MTSWNLAVHLSAFMRAYVRFPEIGGRSAR
ncbi:DUF5953 family protein [Corallococcus sp. EGB]